MGIKPVKNILDSDANLSSGPCREPKPETLQTLQESRERGPRFSSATPFGFSSARTKKTAYLLSLFLKVEVQSFSYDL